MGSTMRAGENDDEAAAAAAEKNIAVFTVLKNNLILKNIFLVDTPPSSSSSSSSSSISSSQEETLMVGRHPHCNITFEHPSISRFHLRIHIKPSSQSLSVIDLSSVHGTWVLGKKIEPGVQVELNEGDTLRLGASSRIYRLHWVPLSRAYDIENPFVPPLGDEAALMEENEEEKHQIQTLEDDSKGLDALFSDMKIVSSTEELIPSAPTMPEDAMISSFYGDEDVENQTPLEDSLRPSQASELVLCSQPDKENSTPKTPDNPESPIVRSVQRSVPSIWSRRGKPSSVQILTGQGNKKSTSPMVDSDDLSGCYENNATESISKNLFPCLNLDSDDDKEEQIDMFTLSKDNCTPDKKIGRENLENESTQKSSFLTLDESDDEIFTPDKENMTPNASLSKSKKKMGILKERKHVQLYKSSPLKNVVGPNVSHENHVLISSDNENQTWEEEIEIFTPDKENSTPKQTIGRENIANESILRFSLSTLDDGDGDEIFTPDKENMTPNTSSLMKSMKKMGKFKEMKQQLYKSSPLKNVVGSHVTNENQTREVLQEQKQTSPTSSNQARSALRTIAPKSKAERVPFQSLSVDSMSKPTIEGQVLNDSVRSRRLDNHSQFKPIHEGTNLEEKKAWTMVVDTASLVNKESRKALQLLQGLQRTNLVIPGIVVRELDCMKRRGSFFKRTCEASSALQWIEDCMVNTKWWICVQSSTEEVKPTAPTPPTTPLSQYSDENKLIWGSSLPFSPSGGFMDIITPKAQDHILECALFFRRITSGPVVLLSDDVTLKINAMAEGLLCETAEQFRESLANPFSDRFLWTNSSPRGPTWSCEDDVVLRERYFHYGPSMKASSKSGLKLILLHNSHYRQKTSVGSMN